VDAGRLTCQDKIGVQVGKIINRHKMAKHFELSIGEASLTWARWQDAIEVEAALDGLYVIRTSVDAKRMDPKRIAASSRLYQRTCAVADALRWRKCAFANFL